MRVETKYNSGNIVFLLADNKVIHGVVDRVGVKLLDTKIHEPQKAIYYTLKSDDRILNGEFQEETLFPSKDELIKSL